MLLKASQWFFCMQSQKEILKLSLAVKIKIALGF